MTGSRWKGAMLAVSLIALMPEVAQAQSNAALQQQIDELKAQVQALTSALAASRNAPAPGPTPGPAAAPVAGEGASSALAATSTPPAAAPVAVAASAPSPKSKAWYEKLSLRGYTQMRYNAFLSGDDSAPAGVSRLRSVGRGWCCRAMCPIAYRSISNPISRRR